MDVLDKSSAFGAPEGRAAEIARGVGRTVNGAEEALLIAGTSRVHRFRVRHPWLYGMIAFVLGGGLVAVFTMTTYSNWVYEGIDLKVALYQVVLGGLGGGIVAVILAFAYAGFLRETLPALKSAAEIRR